MNTDIKQLLDEAQQKGWISQLDGTTLIVFREKMTALISVLRSLIIDQVVRRHHFTEWIFPRLVPEEVLAKMGWLTHHRQEVWFVSPKREHIFDPDEPDLFTYNSRYPVYPLPYALDPVQCVSFYYALFGRSLQQHELPLKVYEYQGGWTHRYENQATCDGLIRGAAFLRLELVWIAEKDEAESLRNQLVRETAALINETMMLSTFFAKGDSCFEEPPPTTPLNETDLVRLNDFNLLEMEPSVDVIIETSKKERIEIISAGRHQQLPNRFQINARRPNGTTESIWSGCLGVGLTRLAAAFLQEHGFDDEIWKTDRIKDLFRKHLSLS